MSTLWQRQCGTKLVSLLRHHVQEERVIEESVFYSNMVGVEAKANDLRGPKRSRLVASTRLIAGGEGNHLPQKPEPACSPDPELVQRSL